jgi:type II secretory ATPase GspE/PulE/Tfp pilus assembly ATPase PilB-like protein
MPTDLDGAKPVPIPDRISREYLVHHQVCPAGVLPDGKLLVSTTDQSLLNALDDLSIVYAREVIPERTTPEDLDMRIARLAADQESVELDQARDESFTSDVRDLANQPPVVRFVNLLIREAYDAGASDIHLESTRAGLATRFRIDGVLQPANDPPASMERAVVSRVKLLAELDIAEHRRPQDGRIRVRLHARELDLRVSTVPTAFGESVVLRLLERGSGAIGLETLGLSPALLRAMEGLSRRPHGMILVTGPTGSGKTTTLYAALGLRSAATEKIITLEDPIEYTLNGVAQVPVHAETGVTFASMLRSILRQDPDVVLVGEMRDAETAELAVQAALTGHVVFSTLHTNDAIGSLPRLLDLGIAPYLIAATLEAVLAQRLVRMICQDCRESYVPDPKTSALLDDLGNAPQLFRGQGCDRCRGTGFSGRTGVFELLVMSDELREALVTHHARNSKS